MIMNFKKKVFIISVFNIGSTISAAASRNLITRSSVRYMASVAHTQQSKPNSSIYYTFDPWTAPLVNKWLFQRTLHRHYTPERVSLTRSQNDTDITPSNLCPVMRVPRTAWLHCKNIMAEQRHKALTTFIKTHIDQAHGMGAFSGATIGSL